MKQIKIMLTSIAIIGVVGGALAFKAKNFGVQYCKGAAFVVGQPTGACPNVVFSTTLDATTPFYATLKNGACPAACTSLNIKAE
jgi:hypothetical protein